MSPLNAPTLSFEEFLHHLKSCKLLPEFEIDRLSSLHPGADSDALGRAFIEAGLLTAHQVRAIAGGNGATLVIGNYDVLDRLGAGGMGTVYKARHRRMKRIVALKVLSRELSTDTHFVQRFQREVETIARLSHPNIVMAYDADEDAAGHFLVMEFVNGRDLAVIVQKQGVLPVREAVDCTLQIARALEYAHRQGIIHRDIKPANILRDQEGVVKVTDLGLARISRSFTDGQTAENSLTKAGGIMGTADYMPPEQAIDAAATDHRADIYCLGGTLYFLLHGRGPYAGGNVMATLLKHRDAPIPYLSDGRVDVSASLDDVFRRMLGKQPHERQQSMAEVVAALEAILPRLGGGPNQQTTVMPVSPLPAQDPSIGRPRPAQTTGPISAETDSARILRVLLVEPSRTQAGIIRKFLQALDIADVGLVATASETLARVRSNCPDVIICAMHLDDMNGAELARQVRAACANPNLGFVLISSEKDGKVEASLSDEGLGVTLLKPFTPAELVSALKLSSPACDWLKPPSGASLANVSRTLTGVTGAVPAVKRGPRVLIVDDSAAARLHEKSVLQSLGVSDIAEAADGAQAVVAVSRDKFDLIVTDYHMPLMDGSGLVGFLKQNPATANVPIIMVTTETDPSKLDAIRKLGVLAICDKKFPAAAVRKILDDVKLD